MYYGSKSNYRLSELILIERYGNFRYEGKKVFNEWINFAFTKGN